MAMHNTNSLLKYIVPAVIIILFVLWVASLFKDHPTTNTSITQQDNAIKNRATYDSAAETLETLTAELKDTKKQINQVTQTNALLKQQNDLLMNQLNQKKSDSKYDPTNAIQQLQSQIRRLSQKIQEKNLNYPINRAVPSEGITTVSDLSSDNDRQNKANGYNGIEGEKPKPAPIPFYTIPANATSVKDKLMTALVGRIPVKGYVVDPYPFKMVVSNDNLAANGLRIPHLTQMIVSGYCEGDLNLMGVRGWVTSLTFVFQDGTISTTTSNDNNIGRFTKENSLGYLSDQYGNPFIAGKLISNAPTYLAGNVLLKGASGAANAYTLGQLTTNTTPIGSNSQALTGSPSKFILGQALSNSTEGALQWWQDRQQQSFDAIYVAPIDDRGQYREIAINFAKEISIDYNPSGRKISYATKDNTITHAHLD